MAVATSILLGYAAVLVVLGLALSRRVRESSQYFVSGRQLGAGLVFSTLLAANIGAGSTVGATGLGYRYGLSAWWWVGSAAIGSVILAWTVGPRIWRVAREHNLYTVGDYLQLRYDARVRGVAALLLWIGSLSILAGQCIAVAWILGATIGFGKTHGCLIAAVLTTAYFSAGGLHSSSRVNVLQLAVKLAGFMLACFYLGGPGKDWDSLRASLASHGVDSGYWSFSGTGVASITRYIAVLAPSFIISPGILQKVFGARDSRAVRLGVGLNAVGLLVFAIVPVLLGAIARESFPGLENSELALPTLLTKLLPPWLGGLLLGAIFSAELSAADAVLFMLTTSLGRDLYQGHIRPSADDSQLMRFTRQAAVACGAAGGLIALYLPSVISALTIFYTLLTAALFLPLFAGLYSRTVTAGGALAAMLSSCGVCLIVEFFSHDRGLWGIPSTIVGIGTGAVLLAIWRTGVSGSSEKSGASESSKRN